MIPFVATGRRCLITALAFLLCILGVFPTPFHHTATAQETDVTPAEAPSPEPPRTLRIATYNVSLYGKRAGEIAERMADRSDPQARAIAALVQTVRPDILLVNELDYQADALPAKRLATNYFAVGQPTADGQDTLEPMEYPFLYSAPSNTGMDSRRDLDRDGKTGSGNDAWGYGVYPGQYAMTVFSRFPIRSESIRTFQKLRWSTMPGAIRPSNPQTGESFYDDATWKLLRLSSKNHIDVPIEIGDQTIHILASHPTPPVFDGPEDRNGARNHDEIAFWNHYLSSADDHGGTADPTASAEVASWMVDDQGRPGGLAGDQTFVIMGDLNADPIDGSGRREAIQQLLAHRRVHDVRPEASADDVSGRGSGNRTAAGAPVKTARGAAAKTAAFGRNGWMRVDYVLPSTQLTVIDSGVFWPAKSKPESRWIEASDHRMVWIDIQP